MDITITVTVPADQVDALVGNLVSKLLDAAPGFVDGVSTPLVAAAAGYDPNAPDPNADPNAGTPAVTSTKVEQTDTTSQTEGAAPDSSSSVTATTEHKAAQPVRDPRTGRMVDG